MASQKSQHGTSSSSSSSSQRPHGQRQRPASSFSAAAAQAKEVEKDLKDFLSQGLASLTLSNTMTNREEEQRIPVDTPPPTTAAAAVREEDQVKADDDGNRDSGSGFSMGNLFPKLGGRWNPQDQSSSSLHRSSSSTTTTMRTTARSLSPSSSANNSSATLMNAGGISDSLIAKCFTKLSAQDRETTLHEIHGIANEMEETEELVQNTIRDTLKELDRLREKQARGVGGGGGGGDLNTSSLERAMQQNPSLVPSRDFLLPFLRTDRFDAIKVARRIVHYFDEKEHLFGTMLLTRTIQLRDLDHRAQTLLQKGEYQILPGRDQGGRAVFFSSGSLCTFRTDEASIRAACQAFWKLSSIATEDELTQKRGVIMVAYNLGGIHCSGAEMKALLRLHKAFPLRLASLHACVDDAATKAMVAVSILLAGDHLSTRYRCHYGSHIEVQYALSTFGIPNWILPVSSSGGIDVSRHQQSLRQIRIQEDSTVAAFAASIETNDTEAEPTPTPVEQGRPSIPELMNPPPPPPHVVTPEGVQPQLSMAITSPSISSQDVNNVASSATMSAHDPDATIFSIPEPRPLLSGGVFCQSQKVPSHRIPGMAMQAKGVERGFIVVPGESDVLLGRGKIIQEHVGNIRYRHILSMHMEKYEAAPKAAKSEILGDIVQLIYNMGGRFLEQHNEAGFWVPVSFETARHKVSHYFRNQKRLAAARADKAVAHQTTKRDKKEAKTLKDSAKGPSSSSASNSSSTTPRPLGEDTSSGGFARQTNQFGKTSPPVLETFTPVLFNELTGDHQFTSTEYFQQVKRQRNRSKNE